MDDNPKVIRLKPSLKKNRSQGVVIIDSSPPPLKLVRAPKPLTEHEERCKAAVENLAGVFDTMVREIRGVDVDISALEAAGFVMRFWPAPPPQTDDINLARAIKDSGEKVCRIITNEMIRRRQQHQRLDNPLKIGQIVRDSYGRQWAVLEITKNGECSIAMLKTSGVPSNGETRRRTQWPHALRAVGCLPCARMWLTLKEQRP